MQPVMRTERIRPSPQTNDSAKEPGLDRLNRTCSRITHSGDIELDRKRNAERERERKRERKR
jgi:hypothetical protein